MATETLIAEVAGSVTAGAVAEKIEFDFSGSIDQIALTAGTAPTSALAVDALLNGTSIYAAPVGTIAGVDSTGQNTATTGISATDTRISVLVDGVTEQGIKKGALIQVESEVMLVTSADFGSNSQQGAGQTDQQGPINSSGTQYTLALIVTRAQSGTTAAAHAHGVNVTAVKAGLPAAATNSGTTPGLAQPINVKQGDVLTFSTSGGAGLADLTIEVEVTRD